MNDHHISSSHHHTMEVRNLSCLFQMHRLSGGIQSHAFLDAFINRQLVHHQFSTILFKNMRDVYVLSTPKCNPLLHEKLELTHVPYISCSSRFFDLMRSENKCVVCFALAAPYTSNIGHIFWLQTTQECNSSFFQSMLLYKLHAFTYKVWIPIDVTNHQEFWASYFRQHENIEKLFAVLQRMGFDTRQLIGYEGVMQLVSQRTTENQVPPTLVA